MNGEVVFGLTLALISGIGALYILGRIIYEERKLIKEDLTNWVNNQFFNK